MTASLFSLPGVAFILAELLAGESADVVVSGAGVGSILERICRKVWMLVRREEKSEGLDDSVAIAEEEVVVSKAGRDAED
jgi:UDP-N-acetylglucosamine transferase subunit ALG13